MLCKEADGGSQDGEDLLHRFDKRRTETHATPLAGRATRSVAGTADFSDAFTYDSLGRMTRVTQQGQSGGNSVAAKRVDLAYSAAGNVSSIDRYSDLAGTSLVATTTFGYDSADRLTGR